MATCEQKTVQVVRAVNKKITIKIFPYIVMHLEAFTCLILSNVLIVFLNKAHEDLFKLLSLPMKNSLSNFIFIAI